MEQVKLSARKRTERGSKTKKGRLTGLVPAVVYGKGIPTESIWINNLDMTRLLKKAGESTLIDLDVDKEKSRKVIIYETQKDPVRGGFVHIDFFQVKMDEKIKKEVELVFIGESAAVKEAGGVLVKNMDAVEVECLPADLPSEITVDITPIKTFDDYIYAKDLKVGKGVELQLDPEAVVALVTPPRSEEELAALSEKVEADVTQVEGMVKPEEPVPGAEGEKAVEAKDEVKKE
jgi:large subunit ribosomal protein L25